MKKYVIILLAAIAFPSFVLLQATTTPVGTQKTAASDDLVSLATSTDEVLTVKTLSFEELASAEEKYFANYGHYLQVLPDHTLPKYLPYFEGGTVAEKLGGNLPANVFVDVYDGPRGKGFVVSYVASDTRYYTGYASEAGTNYSYPLHPKPTGGSATSTDIR